MPICKGCGRYSNVLYRNPCPHCGAADWMTAHYVPKGQEQPPYRPGWSIDFSSAITTGLGFLIVIGLLLGGLWLVVAVVKWMWQHS